jgi:hypothetical protein
MSPGDLVVVHCGAPREKFWGELLSMTPIGVTLRALPLEAFEDFLHQCSSQGPRLLGAVTLFLPVHRIERIELDETAGAAEAMAERFRRISGRDPRQALRADGLTSEDEPASN